MSSIDRVSRRSVRGARKCRECGGVMVWERGPDLATWHCPTCEGDPLALLSFHDLLEHAQAMRAMLIHIRKQDAGATLAAAMAFRDLPATAKAYELIVGDTTLISDPAAAELERLKDILARRGLTWTGHCLVGREP